MFDSPWFVAGLALVVIAAAQCGLLVFSGVRRGAIQRNRRALEGAAFSERLSAARQQLHKKEPRVLAWNGIRKFRIDRVVCECADVNSFYLRPLDGKPLSSFLPGQYLTFDLDIPGQSRRVVRCYSLSDRPTEEHYRVTIKRLEPPGEPAGCPPGLVSNHFHIRLKSGDVLDIKAPNGAFVLDPAGTSPVVLIGGGVGITPVYSMLSAILASGSKREVWFFLGVRNRSEHIFKDALDEIARQHPHLKLHICYSKPDESDAQDRDYHHPSRVTVDVLKKVLPSNNYNYYICGPGPLMDSLTEGLKEWGVPKDRIHFEAFGPASVKRPPPASPDAAPAVALNVLFARSSRKVAWTGATESLLDLAEAQDPRISIDSGCRAGNCGTCKTVLKSGKVKYLKEAGCDVEVGSCLTCICVPETDVVLDA